MKKKLGFGLGFIPKFLWVLGMKPIPKPKTQIQFFWGVNVCLLLNLAKVFSNS